MNLTQAQLARDPDVPSSRIATLIKGSRSVDADMALRLAARFETSPEMWVRLQSDYDLRVARQGKWPEIERQIKKRRTA